jgi:hypothetical protein
MNYEKEIGKVADYSNPLDKRTKALEKLQEANNVKDQSVVGSLLGGTAGTALGVVAGQPLGRLASKLYKKPLVNWANDNHADFLKNQADAFNFSADIADAATDAIRKNGKENLASIFTGAQGRLQRGLGEVFGGDRKLQEDWVQDISGLIGGGKLGALGTFMGARYGGDALGEDMPGTKQAEVVLNQLMNEQDPRKKAAMQQQLASHFKQLEDIQGSGLARFITEAGVGGSLAAMFSHPQMIKKGLKWLEDRPNIAKHLATTNPGREQLVEFGGDIALAAPAMSLAGGAVNSLTSSPEKYKNPF